MRLPIRAATLALALAACANYARVESTSTDGVTVAYPEGSASAAESLANDECRKYGKRAALRSVHANSSEKMGIYDCRV